MISCESLDLNSTRLTDTGHLIWSFSLKEREWDWCSSSHESLWVFFSVVITCHLIICIISYAELTFVMLAMTFTCQLYVNSSFLFILLLPFICLISDPSQGHRAQTFKLFKKNKEYKCYRFLSKNWFKELLFKETQQQHLYIWFYFRFALWIENYPIAFLNMHVAE